MSFVLNVDDFGIKYVNKHDLHHFLDALKNKHEITQDIVVSLYCSYPLNVITTKEQ